MEKLNWEDCMKYAAMGPHKENDGFMKQIGLGVNCKPVHIVTTEDILKALDELKDWTYNTKRNGKI